jgi:ABC-2 type transport system ATP-binding protein
MSETEITSKFDAIVDFSEMEKFLDTEVRHYSSGMFMRLAFATAVHTECEIFLVDEVLAVGDQPFRRKCMARIMDFKKEGRTMVFVSHSPAQVLKVCERGLVLETGKMIYEALPKVRSRHSAMTSATTPTTRRRTRDLRITLPVLL